MKFRQWSPKETYHMTGPKANPNTKSDVPRVPTSFPTWNSASTPTAAAEKMLLPKVADMESKMRIALRRSL
ncbi:hypothetical protein ACEPPN_004897 [Leptodophora sp. 'Broadleaf-Isolate-01']